MKNVIYQVSISIGSYEDRRDIIVYTTANKEQAEAEAQKVKDILNSYINNADLEQIDDCFGPFINEMELGQSGAFESMLPFRKKRIDLE